MNRILLADDSPHAQRMGERILREEGYEIVSVTDGETALLRLEDVDPDVILADAFLPGRSGLEICRQVKQDPKHKHIRVVLTAGMLENFDEAEASAAGTDAILRKPFEASVVLDTLKPLVDASHADRTAPAPGFMKTPPAPATTSAPNVVPIAGPEREPDHKPVVPPPPEPEPEPAPAGAGVSEEELLRAAVTLALDAAFPALVDDITAKVLRNLRAVGGTGAEFEAPPDLPIPVAPLPNDKP